MPTVVMVTDVTNSKNHLSRVTVIGMCYVQLSFIPTSRETSLFERGDRPHCSMYHVTNVSLASASDRIDVSFPA